jgi:hypothetical protein
VSVLTFDHPAEVLRRRAELEADQASAEEFGLFLRMEAELGEPLGPFLEKVSGDSPSLILADYRAALTVWETLTARYLRLKHRAEMLALVLTERAELAASPADMLTAGLEGTDTGPHRRERTRPPRPRGRYCIARHIASNAPPAVVCPVPTKAPHGSAPPG